MRGLNVVSPDGNGRTGRLLINFELLKNNIAPIVIPKEERTKYFNYLANNDYNSLSQYFEELSIYEQVRIKEFEQSIVHEVVHDTDENIDI